ncbi:hypothetical protein MMC30_008592 [Trapelia coarctata]|nr:hypothetical protein [Trapelia coarctata]
MIQEDLRTYVEQAAISIGNPQLTQPERFKLATEVVNVTLKGLTAALKTLQHGGSPRQRCTRRASSTSSSGFDSGALALAECARMAFAELRKLKTTSMSYLQLEKGMSAFINKLIALGMDELAVKELRVLTRRLSMSTAPQDTVSRPQKRGTLQQLEAIPSKQTLTDLLRVEKVPTDPEVLSLITASQVQIMKVIALKKRVPHIEAAAQHLQRSTSYSPVNLLEALTTSPLPEVRKNAVKQLEVLAQFLLSLCPGSAHADDELGTGPRKFPVPHIVLQYQMLVIGIRFTLWKQSDRRADRKKELLDPFARHLRTFSRRSTLKADDTYMTVKSTVESFYNLVTGNPSDVATQGMEHWEGFAEIYRFLAELAQKGRHFADALRFMKSSTFILEQSGASQARRCGALCQYSSIGLQAQVEADNVDVIQMLAELQEAANALRGSLKGDSMDMDELLIRTGELRKSAISALLTTTNPLGGSLELQCIELLLLTSGFLSRYIGQAHGLTDGSKCMTRFEKRLNLATPHIRPTIEAVVSLSKLTVAHGPELWKKIDSALDDCATLLTNAETLAAHIIPSSPGCQSPYVLMSNAYWCHCLRQDKSRSGPTNTQLYLQKSIDFISRRPSVEQTVGLMPVKLEKLAGVHEASNDMRRAKRVYTEALRAQIEAGSLRIAAELAATKPWTRIVEEDAGAKAVARLLAGCLRVSTKQRAEQSNIQFDDEQLAPEERGLLLEQQLTILTSSIRRQEPSAITKLAFQIIASALLEIYTEEQYPVRRLRVCVQLLDLHAARPTILNANLIRQAETTAPSSGQRPGADGGLVRFLPHLLACREVYTAISQRSQHSLELQCTLDIWLGIVRDCKNWAELRDNVDDTCAWLTQLDAIADYLHMQGFEFQRVILLRLIITVLELQSTSSQATYISHLVSYGLQLARLGYSGKAGAVFQKARKHLDNLGMEPHVSFEWHSAYTEYSLLIGNIDKSEHHAREAKILAAAISSATSEQPYDLDKRCKEISRAADMTYLLSLLSLARGSYPQALLLGRRSAKLKFKMWAMFKRRNGAGQSTHTKVAESGVDSPAEDLSTVLARLRIESLTAEAAEDESLGSASFWPLVPGLFHRLLHLSKIYAQGGMLPEAQYYAEEAGKVAKSAGSATLQAQVNAVLGEYHVRRGQHEEGMALLTRATKHLSGSCATQAGILAQIALARGILVSHDRDDGPKALEVAEGLITGMISNKVIRILDQPRARKGELELQMGSLTIQRGRGRGPATKRPTVKATTKPKQKLAVAKCVVEDDFSHYFPVIRLRARVLLQSAELALRIKDLEHALSHISDAEGLPTTQEDTIHHALVAAQLSLHKALEKISSHPVLSILPDSTLSCPSAAIGGRRRSKDGVLLSKDTQLATQVQISRVKLAQKAGEQKLALENQLLYENLFAAFTALNNAHKLAQSTGSLSLLHNLSCLFGKIIMTLSAACPSAPQANICSVLAVYAMELGRSSATWREKSAIEAEKRLGERDQLCLDEDFELLESLQLLGHSELEMATFQSDYIDIIPKSWTVVTMSLCESRNEIRVARLRASQAPFVLVIPLNRHGLRDSDEESFGFDDGKTELLDIIKLGNYSTRDPVDMSKKGAKTEWWEARAALDARLKDLLTNIENIWFGGFRGVFSQLSPRQDLLSRFQRSFTNTLNKHLPSRRKAGKEASSTRVILDARVLELFVGLGDPADVEDLDEHLMDLLYFVIDILQFNGERNAYDEIEFDSIAVETLDALTHYHQAVREDVTEKADAHTILILDRALHCFPWESLPCMSRQAISRLPSLRSLRSRILKQQYNHLNSEGLHIDSTSGAYILNPAGDLRDTESTFLTPLSTLTSWSGTTNQIPAEEDILTALSTRSLYLYFGHGSGGQYIRARTIKKLDRCAVALLMGCSSATLTEEGEFESHGVPMNHLQAGAQAVVGTLWDVTDRDIDRFSLDVLERWGLFEKQQIRVEDAGRSPVKKGERGKRKVVKVVDSVSEGGNRRGKSGKGKVSLDQAVAAGREVCIMKYLNGAAPVVYGVPVFLK